MADVTAATGMAVGTAISGRVKRAFDWTMLVWLGFAAVLIVIVVNPIFRLVWESISAETGGLTLVGAWILIFVPACQELSTAIFLSGPNNRVLSVLIFDFSEEGRFEQLAVLGGLLLIVTVIIVAIGFRIVGRDFMLRRQ